MHSGKVYGLMLLCTAQCQGSVLWAAGLGTGREYGNSDQQEEEEKYSAPRQINEEEGRQKDLGKWIKDLEIIKREQKKPVQKTSNPQPPSRAQNYLNTPKTLPSQPGLLEGQAATQADVEESLGLHARVQDTITQEFQAARGIAKAGNSIQHRGDGAVFMFYHGLLMGAKNQHYRSGLNLDTVIDTQDVRYDFSRRLMAAFRKNTTDPRGNHSIEERSDITYTSDSSGLPGQLQRVTGYRDRLTDIDGNVTIVTRTNGQYNDRNNPSYNNADYAASMITDYDETSQIEGDDARVTTTHFRNGTYDAFGNVLKYTQTVIYSNGEVNVTERLSSILQKNSNYVNERPMRHPQINYTRPEYFLVGYDQYTADYGFINGNQVYEQYPPQIQHYTKVTYDDQDRMTGWFRANTLPDNQTILSVTGYSISSFDPFGNPLTWRIINTDSYGVLSLTDRELTVYNQTNHETMAVEHTVSENGTDSTTTRTMTYDKNGNLLFTQTHTDSTEFTAGPNQISLENKVVSEAGPAYPHGMVLPTFTGGF